MDEKVGKFWDHYVTKKASRLFKDEAVLFENNAKTLKIFYHLLGGEKGKELHITDKRFINTSRTLLEKMSGTGKTFFLAWQDGKGLYLPAALAYFPSKAHNEMHYYWLIAMLTKVNIKSQNIEHENTIVINDLIKKYAGFHEFYTYAQNYLSNQYPELSTNEPSREGSSADNYPNPLWIYPSLSSSNKLLDTNDDEEILRQNDEQRKSETLQMKKKSEQIDDKKETDGLLLFLPESILSFMEQVRVDRQENDSFDEDALYNAEDLDEITLGQKDANLSARIKMDLDISANSIEEYPLGKGHFIDEWDYKKESYLKNYVCIKPFISLHTEPIGLPKRLQKMMRRIQSELDLMELDRIKRDNLPYGDEINIDTWIDYKGHQNRSNHPQRFFQTFERKTRDMSTLILADVSLSTEAGITQELRVIDMIQDSLMVFAESLHRLQDRFAIYTFSSIKNTKVNFHIIKNFKEKYSDAVRGRIHAIKPGYYTRLGAGIRESAKILEKQQSQNKLLLILSDGKPNDVDRYDGRYGIEDTKKAIEEVKQKGITPFCITIDIDAKEYLPYLFGRNSYAVIRDAKKLPKVLPEIYMNLTK
ncbi:VWA domain-containing protein [Sulfuricurvum sp.]|uniref:nitric oxide reductase activation protein NorD n=1 Tax=Sulfuricurvum sp. TaxID=2025608 RepID=UPI002619F8B4|nr:VWA domain-containing protein [Sulfuricurvum sp.]MDD2266786.1 VWA domain-containing protein [Sulfuricurvum sp.]MDD2784033.1 VWA domain-containing protein [Sulfuricurvum sp.]